MDNRQMWMEQILRLLELATEEQLRVLYTAALYLLYFFLTQKLLAYV